MASKKKDFLSAMETVAGNHRTAKQLINWIKEYGRSVSVLRTVEPYPKLTEEEYRVKREEAKAKTRIMFGEDSDEEVLPEKYEDFLKMMETMPKVPGLAQYKIVFPDDFAVDSQIGLCQVSAAAQDNFLPGLHLAGYSRHVMVHSQGVEIAGHVLYYLALGGDSFWHGLARLHAAYLAKQNMEDPEGDESLEAAAQRGIRQMLQRTTESLSDKRILFQIEADRLLAELVDIKLGGLMKPILQSFFQSAKTAEQYLDACKTAAQFIKSQLGVAKPVNTIDEVAGDRLLERVVLASVFASEILIKIYKETGLINPKPFLQHP